MTNAKISVLSMRYPSYPELGKNCNYEKALTLSKNYIKESIECVLPDRPDLIILPENCDHIMEVDSIEFCHYKGDAYLEMLGNMARDNQCRIAYSSVRKAEDGKIYNSTQMIDKTGKVMGCYDKNYVTIGESKKGICYGEQAELMDLGFAKAACAICFDLNFDELLYRYKEKAPKLIVFSSSYHGGIKQYEWAYKTGAYFAGSIGNDAESRIINPFGETVARTTNYYKYVTGQVNFDYIITGLGYNRTKLDAAKKKYGEIIRIHEPGYLSPAMLTSLSEEISAEEIAREFEMEIWYDYLKRNVELRTEALKRD